jgi:uncharacterized C2H2 Zn-finger protein
MVDDLEVYCPDCGKLFKGQNKMLRHVETDHVGKKEHAKEVVLELDARYLGGHLSFAHQTNGLLSLYSHPLNKVVFESDDFMFEIPVYSIVETKIAEGKEIDGLRAIMLGLVSPVVGAASLMWRKTNKVFYIQFQDETTQEQTVIFDHSDSMDEFANQLKEIISTNGEVKGYDKLAQSPILKVSENPLDIIKVRYARGEITKEQYEEMKRTLTS